jgi:hypothetical protein
MKYYLKADTIKAGSTSYTRFNYLYSNPKFSTDSGVIIQSYEDNVYFQMSSILNQATPDPVTPYFAQILLGLSDFQDVYERKYIKMQEIAANISGIIKFIGIILQFLVSHYAYVPFLESVYNKYFHDPENFNTKNLLPNENLQNNSGQKSIFKEEITSNNFLKNTPGKILTNVKTGNSNLLKAQT